MKALVTGATGLIGARLLAQLEQPVVLSRHPAAARRRFENHPVEVHAWDPESNLPPAEAFDGVEVVFHLAGESVGEGRWTAAKKQRIRDSRVAGTGRLVAALAALPKRPAVLVSGSAIGYYGSRDDQLLDESSSAGSDFLADVCVAWEHEANEAATLGMRVVTVRTGIVLARQGGALAKMHTPFKLGLGGRLGSGRQWMSWIHLDDAIGLMLHAARQSDLRGPLNVVSPNPATNRDFTRTLGRVLGRPTFLPAPAFALKLALGEFAEVLLASQRVVPRVAEKTGYVFQHPQLHDALDGILAAGS